jgi:3-hydroxyacyl-CoA dehydrogenase / enoyl-CoA hydratase / 3-hydroxybutyryl-CoA epimerase / enoyl-CoA isomerase
MASAFQLHLRDDAIAELVFDQPVSKVNTLSRRAIEEFSKLVERLEDQPDVKGMLFRSGKPGQFVAGADLNELGSLSRASKQEIDLGITLGHDLFGRISRLPFPTVALIDGPCVGGGVELILAMDDRIAAANEQTTFTAPEVMLGLIPAWGGTQRLPRLIGLNAIEIICSGQPVSAKRAVALGLAFDLVPPDRLIEEGCRRLEQLKESGAWIEHRRQMQQPLSLSEDQFRFAFAVAEGQVKAKTQGQYPAPVAALHAIRDGCTRELEEGLAIERTTALEVIGTPTSAHLIEVFFMKNRLAHSPGVTDPTVRPRPVGRVGVLGAGQMGSGIAAAHARSGFPTAMVDIEESCLALGLKRAQQVVTSRIKIGRATSQDLTEMLSRLSTSTAPAIFADCDVVIEAITEDEAVKTSMCQALASVLGDQAILASNTSTIPITRMARAAPRPERFAGMHFFHPVDRMELVEVIRGEPTSDETVATLVALAKRLRKTPIVVRDCPGFLVTRLLFPYMSQALQLLQEGASPDQIDEVAVRFGMPMGPIAVLDLVGLDTVLAISRVMAEGYPDRAESSPLIADMVREGRLGKKVGTGFRLHGVKGPRPVADATLEKFLDRHRLDKETPDQEVSVDRLFLPMLLEAVRVLDEEIVRNPADVDIGVILGIGFPAFRGGILHWCDSEGAGSILDRLARYESLGPWFRPSATFLRMARTGETFFSRGKGSTP